MLDFTDFVLKLSCIELDVCLTGPLQQLDHDLVMFLLICSSNNDVIEDDVHTVNVSKYGFILLLKNLWGGLNAEGYSFKAITAIRRTGRAEVTAFII